MVQPSPTSRKEFNRAVQAISRGMDRAFDKADKALKAGKTAEGDAYLAAYDDLEEQLVRIFDLRDEYFRSDRQQSTAEQRLADGAAEAERLLKNLRSAASFLRAAGDIADKVTEVVTFLKGF